MVVVAAPAAATVVVGKAIRALPPNTGKKAGLERAEEIEPKILPVIQLNTTAIYFHDKCKITFQEQDCL